MDDENVDYSGYGNLTGSELAQLAATTAGNEKAALGNSSVLSNIVDYGKRLFTGQGSGADYGNAAAVLAGLYGAGQSSAPTIYNPGYTGGIPEVKATREMLTAPPAGRRPGSTGINYGGDVTYTPTGRKLTADNIGGSGAGAGITGADRNVAANWGVAESMGSYLPMYDLIKNYSEADLRSKFGLSDADIQYIYSRPGIAAGTRPPEIMQAWSQAEQTKDYAPLETITRTFTPEQLQDYFKLSGADLDYIYSRPGTGRSTATNEDLMDAWAQAEKTGNYAGLSALLKGQTPESLKSRFGLSDADIQYIYSRPGVSRLRKGGLAADGFVVPADVVSHFGNGSSEAGLKFLAEELGAKPIKGEGDGMSDSIPTTIDGKQPARVANDEAFISPEVVKRLGGGDTDRGAKKLYAMMDRIRKARTGTTEQGKEINPEKFMPGGKVNRYADGGIATTSGGTSLSEWAGPYVADMLGKGKALSEMPYQAYTGPLTAGASPLQEQAFGAVGAYTPPAAIGEAAGTAGNIAQKAQDVGYTPVGGLFDTAAAQQYMNPYLQAALDPQLKELQRQADIQRMADAARLTKAGAFGGSRQAIMESEGRRNLLGQQADVLGKGYATAYDKAMAQFNEDQRRKVQEAQFGSELGLKGLQTGLQGAEAQGRLGATQGQAQLDAIRSLADLGSTQRAIESEGIAADRAQFEEARLNPYKMLQFQQSLLSGLPLAAQTVVQPGQSNLQQFAGGFTTVAQALQALGVLPKNTTPTKP